MRFGHAAEIARIPGCWPEQEKPTIGLAAGKGGDGFCYRSTHESPHFQIAP